MQLILEYPLWFILFCVLAGLLGSFLLYWKNRHFVEEQGWNKYLQWGMAFFRFLSITLLSFLLLSPFIKSKFVDTIDPIVVFVHDNTESMLLGFNDIDSTKYLSETNAALAEIGGQYDIEYFTFDSELHSGDTLNFSGKISNLSNVLDELQGLYFNRNVGAVILATDGIYNEGINPYYTDFDFPIYSIAMGDTTVQKDLKISNIRSNKIAYLDDKVSVGIDVESYSCSGENYKVTVYRVNGGKLSKVTENSARITKNYTEQESTITINASSVGMQRYRAVVTSLDGEITYENNSRDFYIDVIDSRQKILLVANAPHPDIAALKQSIETNKNYDFTIQYADQFNAKLEQYNLIILHQLPSNKFRAANIIEAAKKAKLPIWFITGAASRLDMLSSDQNLLQVSQSGNTTNDASAFSNISFNIFGMQESTLQKIKRFPPLLVPFGNYENGASAKVLLYQRIGAVETDFPILSFNENFGVKNAIFVGDGLWRWRMYDYLDNGNHEAFDEIIQKTINYLAVKADKRKFRVNTSNNAYYEGEMITIEAELYNESYELVNGPEATLLVTDDEGKEFPFNFSANNQSYVVKTNSLPVANYSYKGAVTYNGKKYTAAGAFSVQELQLEALQTKANHNLLQQLSDKTNGAFFYPDEWTELQNTLLSNSDMKPTLYETSKTRSIINLYGIFFLLMGLLAVEWFLRKYLGGY